jgi:hypothetical protein
VGVESLKYIRYIIKSDGKVPRLTVSAGKGYNHWVKTAVSIAGRLLDVNRHCARYSSDFIQAGRHWGEPEMIAHGVEGLNETARETVKVMDDFLVEAFRERQSLGSTSDRLGGWWFAIEADEIIDNLRSAIAVDSVITESLARDATIVEKSKVENLIFNARRMNSELSMIAVYIRGKLKKANSTLWGPELDVEFEKYLNFKR